MLSARFERETQRIPDQTYAIEEVLVMSRFLSDVVEVLASVSVCIPCTTKEMSSWSWSIFNIRLPLVNYPYILDS